MAYWFASTSWGGDSLLYPNCGEHAMTREEKINILINRMLFIDAEDNGDLLIGVLRNGCKGYRNMTDDELNREFLNEFGDED
jgi:hypothetical protein